MVKFEQAPSSETIPLEGSLKVAPNGSIALDAMVEKNKPLLNTVH